MKRTSGQKGITLIALIITIIVLLILAVVTIRAVKGDGIINYAKNSRSAYELAQLNEQARLDSYKNRLENERGNIIGGNTSSGATEGGENSEPTVITWTQTKGRVTNGAGRTIEVGDYINYASKVSGYTDTNGWRVLGAEDGKILLISAKSVANSVDMNPSNYNTTQTKIQNVCGKYDAGTHVVANSARTLKAQDIHRIAGYTFNGSSADGQVLSITRVNPDENDGIGFKWTITKNGTTIKEGQSAFQEAFYKYGLTELALGETFTEEYVGLSGSYELKDYLGDSPQALDMFTDMTGASFEDWETASQCFVNDWWFEFTHEDGGDEWSNGLTGFCGYNSIYGGYLGYDYPQWNFQYGEYVGPDPVKLYAVVTLNQDITLTPAGDHAWTLPTE